MEYYVTESLTFVITRQESPREHKWFRELRISLRFNVLNLITKKMLTRKRVAQNDVTTGAGAGLGLRSQLYISVTGLQSLVFGCTIVIIQPSWSHIKVSFLMKQISKKFKTIFLISNLSQVAWWLAQSWAGRKLSTFQMGRRSPIIKMCLCLFVILVFLFV